MAQRENYLLETNWSQLGVAAQRVKAKSQKRLVKILQYASFGRFLARPRMDSVVDGEPSLTLPGARVSALHASEARLPALSTSAQRSTSQTRCALCIGACLCFA